MTDYSDLAASYDDVYADRLSRAENIAVREMITPWLNGRDVIDVGCGTGLARSLSLPRRYVGFDACPEMIEQAKIQWDGTPHVHFRVGNADLLQLPEDCCDAIVCLWAWPYFNEPSRVLRSWMRALKPRGDAIILSWDARHAPTLITDQPSLAAPIGLVTAHAAVAGFSTHPLGGLCGRVRGRRLARALPLSLAASFMQTGAESPQWLLRLHKPAGHIPRVRPRAVTSREEILYGPAP